MRPATDRRPAPAARWVLSIGMPRIALADQNSQGIRAMSVQDQTRLKRRKFRELLQRKRLTVMPGGFSPLYARVAQEAGFECFFLAGSQLSAFLYGLPDNGIIGLRDLVDHARHMAARCDIPIFVDADTGFGNAVNVHFTVQECVRSGAAGLQIE